jgi:hypothetical protein
MLQWEPGKVFFKTTDNSGRVISEHVFNSGTPAPANERVHIDLYDFHHSEGSSNQPDEAIIKKFEFTPEKKSD